MSRAVPWRNKPSAAVVEMLETAKELRLYQMGEVGPTSFVFQDDSEAKFKVEAIVRQVSIGRELSCSCSGRMLDHCVHTLYVLLRKFKVEESNPILWQGSYLDGELEELVEGKHSKREKRQPIRTSIRKRIREAADEEELLFPQVADDDECPICAEVLKTECYSQCQQCRNCMHSRCLKIWTTHKMASKAPVTCPMCRAHFNRPLEMVKADEQKWADRLLIHRKTKCSGCGVRNIKGNLFQCMHCANVKVCTTCFQGNFHSQHNDYLVMPLPQSEWGAAISKNVRYRNSKIEEAGQKIYVNLDYTALEQFALDVVPTIKIAQEGNRNIASLGIIGNEMGKRPREICQRCGKVGNELMRRLECGHNAHDECLLEMLRRKELQCGVDGETILKGYASVLGIRVNTQPKRQAENNDRSNQPGSIIKRPTRLFSGNKAETALDQPLGIGKMLSRKNLSQKEEEPSARAFRIKRSFERRRDPVPPPSLPQLHGLSFLPQPSRLLPADFV